MKLFQGAPAILDVMADELLDPNALRQRLAASMKLVETTRTLAAENDLDRVLKIVAQSACEALSCERASLFLYDQERGEIYSRVTTELEIEEIRSSIEDGITGWVARRRKVANIAEPSADARWNSSIDRKTGFKTRNILAAPLVSKHNDGLVGVLQLLNKYEDEFDAFDEELIQAFASHAATAIERAQLVKNARRRHELEVSIEMGRSIQTNFLPDVLPEIPGYELAAWWQPAEAVGGDYYDVVELPDGRLGLIVADVSGHGVGPSLIMASVRAMLRVLTRTCSDPGRILSLLTETIDGDLAEGRFITFLIVALDPKTHEMTFANAGHGPALHFCRRTGNFQQLESTSLPMGFETNFSIPSAATITLEPGDLLLLATDGAIELKDDKGEIFGRQGLERIVTENRKRPASELLPLIRNAINDFRSNTPPTDDITLMLLERKMG